MITMLGLFIVVTYVEQRLIVLPNTAGKKELYGSNPCLFHYSTCYLFVQLNTFTQRYVILHPHSQIRNLHYLLQFK